MGKKANKKIIQALSQYKQNTQKLKPKDLFIENSSTKTFEKDLKETLTVPLSTLKEPMTL